MKPRFFKDAVSFRRWLDTHHTDEREVWLGFFKAASGKRTFTYEEALEEALCFGWIDGVRRSLDAESYVQRFTPRTAKSYWSAVNTKRVLQLKRQGRMHPAGLAAFERRDMKATARYSFERATSDLDAEMLRKFKANAKAWQYFESEAPWYRRVVTHWVTSAKKDETKRRRLETLIADSAAGRRIGPVPARKKGRPVR